jgi:hypothetical protein
MLRKLTAAALIGAVALTTSLPTTASAIYYPPKPPIIPPASGTSGAAGAGAVGGFIGFVAILGGL